MTLPTQADITKRKTNLEKLLKQIDRETGKSIEYKMLTVVRGAIRKSWMSSPTKLSYLELGIVPDMDDTNRRKWKCQCEICKEWFKIADIQIDHVDGHNTFTQKSDFENYFDSILMVGYDGLQRLCLDCHSVKTYMDAHGLTFEQAEKEKGVIKIINLTAAQQKKWLKDRGVKAGSNEEIRRNQIRNVLEEEMKNESNN